MLHLLEWASGQSPTPGAVSLKAMRAGIALAEWFAHETRRAYAMIDESDEDRERRMLVEYVEKNGGSITVRRLSRGPRLYQVTADAETSLDDLAKRGWGRWVVDNHGGGPGRPARRFVLSDADTIPPNKARNHDSVSVSSEEETDDVDLSDF